MRPEEFAQQIKLKYPNGVASDGTPYAEMDDIELTRRVVEKHPAYQSKVQMDEGLIGSPVGAVKDFASGVKGSLKERGGDIGEEISGVAKGEAFTPRKQLRLAGAVGGAVGDVTFEALKLIAPKFVEDFASEQVGKVAGTDKAQEFIQRYSELKEKHPEAMRDVEDVINIAELIPILKGGSAVTKAGKGALGKVSTVTGEALDARRVARVTAASNEIDSVVGKIVQGKKGDITKAKRALSTIDTTDVKNYGDLKTKVEDGVEALARKVDDSLESVGESLGPLKSDDLVVSTKVGGTTVNQNYVEKAISHLDELYTKIEEPASKARITNLKNKLDSEGLTLKEVNDLSREYGREFANRAFSKKSGEPLTGVNVQAFENIRKGIKKTTRDMMPDDTTKMLDGRMHDLLETRRLVASAEEKANRLWQRVQKRGVAERVARRAADVTNAATFNTLPAFLSRMLPSNVGLKTMNYIDIEKALNKNLKKLDDLLKTTDDKVLEDKVVKMLKKNTNKVDDAGLESASGAVLGFETYEDENGQLKVRFNPVKGFLGVGATTLGTKVLKGNQSDIVLKNLDPPVKRLLTHPEGEGLVNNLKRLLDKSKVADAKEAIDFDVPQLIKEEYEQIFKRKAPAMKSAKGRGASPDVDAMMKDLTRLRDDTLQVIRLQASKKMDRSIRGDAGRFAGSKAKGKDFEIRQIKPGK